MSGLLIVSISYVFNNIPQGNWCFIPENSRKNGGCLCLDVQGLFSHMVNVTTRVNPLHMHSPIDHK